MQNPANPIIRRLLPGLILGFFVITGLAVLGDVREVRQSLLRFGWQYFFAALGLTLINYGLRFIKWHYYLSQIGARIPVFESMRLFVAGFPLAVTPGKIGEALKAVWLNRAADIPVGRGVSVVLAERISDGLAVMILSILGVISYPQYWPVFALILGLLVLVVVVFQFRPAADYLFRYGERIPRLARLTHAMREFYEGSFTLFRPLPMLIAVGLGTISWLCEGIGFYCILLGLGMPASVELMAASVFILSFSTAVGAVSALPGGLGAAEVSIAAMLTLILGMPPAEATSATVLIRLATLWFGVTLGLVTWIFSADLLGMAAECSVAAKA